MLGIEVSLKLVLGAEESLGFWTGYALRVLGFRTVGWRGIRSGHGVHSGLELPNIVDHERNGMREVQMEGNLKEMLYFEEQLLRFAFTVPTHVWHSL